MTNYLEYKQILIRSQEQLKRHLEMVVQSKDNHFEYTTFGKVIESFVTDKLIEIFSTVGFITGKDDYHLAQNKNEFPDFTLLKHKKTVIAIEIKTGNRAVYDKKKKVWKSCKNSENDMGTLNMWQKKINKFGGENIFIIFIEYLFDDHEKKIVDVKVDNFYKFVGLMTDGSLKYREKDGNLRPKNFDQPPLLTSLDQFLNLIPITNQTRSKNIILKHWKLLTAEQKNQLLNELRAD